MYKKKLIIALSSLLALGRVNNIYAQSPGRSTFQLKADEVARYERPSVDKRSFHSEAVERLINKIAPKIKDPKLRRLFVNCYPNTLDTTVQFELVNGRPKTFVITGDIKAMWLRDSSAQVFPYLPLVREDKHLALMIKGLIRKQIECVLLDPYANAFNNEPIGSYWETDKTQKMDKMLHERKWEIDSLCYVIRLAYHYWLETGDTSIFDSDWQRAMELVVKTFKEQQRKDGLGSYSFMRDGDRASDTHLNNGFGAPVKPNGLIYSAFRPSDDATQYGFLIPSNMFAVVSLKQLVEIGFATKANQNYIQECRSLAKEVNQAIERHAVVNHPVAGQVYAYEVDGFGNNYCMDDANIPSLLSAPYLGYLSMDNPLYLHTRKLIWSKNNPYFFQGKWGAGVGGPHVGLGQAWPMSIIMRALTSKNKEEIRECLTILCHTDAGTGFMHESFDVENPKKFTRKWFAWANTLFGELIVKVYHNYPELLNETYFSL